MEFMKKALGQVDIQGKALYDLVFFASLKESEEDIKNGRVMTIEESKARLKKEYDYLNI